MTNWLSTRLDCGNSERAYYFFASVCLFFIRRSRLTGIRNYMNYADVNDSCGCLTRLPKTPKAGRTLRRALPAAGAVQGLWNGRVSVRLSVPSIDSSSGVRLVCCWAPCSRRVQAIDRYLLQVPALSSKCVRRHVESRGTRFNTDTHARLTALFRDYHYQKGKTNLDFTEARDVSGSGISWAIHKSAPHPRQITTPAPHLSVFYRPDALPAAQPTASKHVLNTDLY